jgi:hypothetical protein
MIVSTSIVINPFVMLLFVCFEFSQSYLHLSVEYLGLVESAL